MDGAGPSLARRALAALILVVVVVVALRMVIGAVTAIVWLVAVVALIIAALWATSTLRSWQRERLERRERTMKPSAAGPALTSPDDRVAAEMRRIQEQLREQGRL